MSRKQKEKGRIGGVFVPVLKEMLACKAWLNMNAIARLLYIALKARYGFDIKNNGRIYLSIRTAMEETGFSFNAVRRGFQELEHYGFIVPTARGCLGSDGHGKAPHWRLTELGYKNEPPTKDYLKWDGVLYEARRKSTRMGSVVVNLDMTPLERQWG
jgi:hypothetical protein